MPLNVKSFYSNKFVKCCFLQDAIEEVEQEDVDPVILCSLVHQMQAM